MNLSQIVIVAVIVGLIVYDVLAGKLGQTTESQVLRDWGEKWVTLPFIAGFLACHWFMNVSTPLSSGWMIALPLMLVLLSWDIWWIISKRPFSVLYRYPGIWLVLGGVTGTALWSQTN